MSVIGVAEEHAQGAGVDPTVGAPALSIRNLSKEFAGNRALNAVDLHIEPGRIHVLVGQNGSGKSTLIKVLAGYHVPEHGGDVQVVGKNLHFGHPDHAYHLGCRFVHQDLALVDDAMVVDNLFLGGQYPMRFGRIDSRRALALAKQMLDAVGVNIDVRRKVSELTASQRTGVAIARALRHDPHYPVRVLVLDEPTATLPANEVNHLVRTVRTAAASGVAVLYVTHHMNEVFRVGDQITILRDGVAVHSGPVGGLDENEVVFHLTGTAHQPNLTPALREVRTEQPTVVVEKLRADGVEELSFTLAAGEVLGIAGITGSGREVVLGAMFGSSSRLGGEVFVDGKRVPGGRPDLAIGLGLAFLPPDRKVAGSFAGLTAQENLTILRLRAFWRRLLMRRRLERDEAISWFRRLDVRPLSTRQLFGTFSGGNQQKILFGKWLSTAPRLFLLDEPTQGVDVGAKAQLHREIQSMAASGTAVIVSSTDLEELATICSRTIVLRHGRVDRVLEGDGVTVGNLTEAVLSGSV